MNHSVGEIHADRMLREHLVPMAGGEVHRIASEAVRMHSGTHRRTGSKWKSAMTNGSFRLRVRDNGRN